MQKWEYMNFTTAYGERDDLGIVKTWRSEELVDWKERRFSVDRALAQLGDDGWELVTVVWRTIGGGGAKDPVYLFKRPVEEQ